MDHHALLRHHSPQIARYSPQILPRMARISKHEISQRRDPCSLKITFSYCIIFRNGPVSRKPSFHFRSRAARSTSCPCVPSSKKPVTHHGESLPVMSHQSRITALKIHISKGHANCNIHTPRHEARQQKRLLVLLPASDNALGSPLRSPKRSTGCNGSLA